MALTPSSLLARVRVFVAFFSSLRADPAALPSGHRFPASAVLCYTPKILPGIKAPLFIALQVGPNLGAHVDFPNRGRVAVDGNEGRDR